MVNVKPSIKVNRLQTEKCQNSAPKWDSDEDFLVEADKADSKFMVRLLHQTQNLKRNKSNSYLMVINLLFLIKSKFRNLITVRMSCVPATLYLVLEIKIDFMIIIAIQLGTLFVS